MEEDGGDNLLSFLARWKGLAKDLHLKENRNRNPTLDAPHGHNDDHDHDHIPDDSLYEWLSRLRDEIDGILVTRMTSHAPYGSTPHGHDHSSYDQTLDHDHDHERKPQRQPERTDLESEERLGRSLVQGPVQGTAREGVSAHVRAEESNGCEPLGNPPSNAAAIAPTLLKPTLKPSAPPNNNNNNNNDDDDDVNPYAALVTKLSDQLYECHRALTDAEWKCAVLESMMLQNENRNGNRNDHSNRRSRNRSRRRLPKLPVLHVKVRDAFRNDQRKSSRSVMELPRHHHDQHRHRHRRHRHLSKVVFFSKVEKTSGLPSHKETPSSCPVLPDDEPESEPTLEEEEERFSDSTRTAEEDKSHTSLTERMCWESDDDDDNNDDNDDENHMVSPVWPGNDGIQLVRLTHRVHAAAAAATYLVPHPKRKKHTRQHIHGLITDDYFVVC